MLYLGILKAKSELEGYIVNYFSEYFSSVVINEKKEKISSTKILITGLEENLKNTQQKGEAHEHGWCCKG